jgi:hypothetical protein
LREGDLAAVGVILEGYNIGHDPQGGVLAVHQVFRSVLVASVNWIFKAALRSCVKIRPKNRHDARDNLI